MPKCSREEEYSKRKKGKTYLIDPEVFHAELLNYKANLPAPMTESLGKILLDFIDGMSQRNNFIKYYGNYMDTMKFRALMECIRMLQYYSVEAGMKARQKKYLEGKISYNNLNLPVSQLSYSFFFRIIYTNFSRTIGILNKANYVENPVMPGDIISLLKKKDVEHICVDPDMIEKYAQIDDGDYFNSISLYNLLMEKGIPEGFEADCAKLCNSIQTMLKSKVRGPINGRTKRSLEKTVDRLVESGLVDRTILSARDPLELKTLARAARLRDQELKMVNAVIEDYIARYGDTPESRIKIKNFMRKYDA